MHNVKNAKSTTSELRKEYLLKKKHNDIIVEKAAFAWVEKNVVLITEKMDRRTIKRLIDSIVKFDEKFTTIKDKIPSVAKILDDAETSLNLVLAGKTSDSRAEDVLKHLSIIYTLLSDFFAGDLPVLLRAPMFKVARENPKLRLDSISVPGHNPSMIAETIEKALRPSKDEIKLLSKVYRGVSLPSLNATAAANEMLSLTLEELTSLTQINRIPMVATEPSAPKSEVEEPVITESVGEQTLLESIILSEQEGVDKLEILIGNIDKVKKIIDSDKNLKDKLSGTYEKLRSAALAAYNDKSFKESFKELLNTDVRNLTKSPQGKIIAQAEMAVNTFKSLGGLAPTIEKMVDKDQITDEDVKLVRDELQKALKGGVLQRTLSVLKTQPFPGLDSESIINALVTELEKEVQIQADAKKKKEEEGQKASETQTPTTEPPTNAPGPPPGTLSESKQNFINMFKSLATTTKALVTGKDIAGPSSTAKPTQGGAGTQGADVTTPGSSTTGGLQTAGTSGSSGGLTPNKAPGANPNLKTQGGLAEVPDDASDAQLQAITAKVGVEPDRLKKLATTRGVRLLVDPKFFQIK